MLYMPKVTMRLFWVVTIGFVLSGMASTKGLAQDRIAHCVMLGPLVFAEQDGAGVAIRAAAEAFVPQSDLCAKVIAADSLTYPGARLALADPAMTPIRDAFVYHDPPYDLQSFVLGFCLGLDPSHAQQVDAKLWHYPPVGNTSTDSWVLADPVLRVDCYERLPSQPSRNCSYFMAPGGGLIAKGGFALNDLPPENFATAFGALSRYLQKRAITELLPLLPKDEMLKPRTDICLSPR